LEDIKSGKGLPAEKADAPPKYEVRLAGKVFASYRRLCAACTTAVDALLTDVATKRTKKTSVRKG
jgi:hypothetical protein